MKRQQQQQQQKRIVMATIFISRPKREQQFHFYNWKHSEREREMMMKI